MAQQADRITRHRLATSKITTVISISLVLFIIGLLGIVIINARIIADNVRENIGFEIMLASDITEGELSQLKNDLMLKPYVKSLKYNTKEENARETAQMLGHNFQELVGSIIPASIQLKIKSEYISADSLLLIEKTFLLMPVVKDFHYEKTMVNKINENLQKIGFILLSVSGILLIISIVLISNTIRLSIYSTRFLIRSMLLVGAKRKTIYGPFILTGILQGIWGAIVAVLLLFTLFFMAYSHSFFSEIIDFSNYQPYAGLLGSILLLGVLITWLSTWTSVRKYIKMKIDKLY